MIGSAGNAGVRPVAKGSAGYGALGNRRLLGGSSRKVHRSSPSPPKFTTWDWKIARARSISKEDDYGCSHRSTVTVADAPRALYAAPNW